MADNNIFNDKDSMDINELAALNDDISPELIEQLQQKLTQEANSLEGKTTSFNEQDDTTLFEEPNLQNDDTPKADASSAKKVQPQADFDDTFMKKYQAKLNNTKFGETEKETENTITAAAFSGEIPPAETTDVSENNNQNDDNKEHINKISNGKILEKALTPEQKNYNDSLDFLDGNVKYSKYVIYVDPQNVDFIESLTVKERKNLINNILRQQDDIKITKQRFKIVQTIIRHAMVAILTIAIFIPIIYYAINASLEATINNYRRSQTNWEVLYKEHGKINQR